MARGITRSVLRSLMEDSRRRAEEAATEIGVCLESSTGGTDPCGSYTILKRWYWHASVRAPNPSRTDMDNFRGDFQNLYHREEPQPPGLPLATHVYPTQFNDKIPSEADLEAAVHRLHPHRAGVHTHFRMEHFQKWRREAYSREKLKTHPQMEIWLCMVDIVQHLWHKGEIPQELVCTVIVTITKGATNTQGIGMLDTLQKVVGVLIDNRSRTSLQLHDVLHGFRDRRGTMTAIME